ncbi:LA-related protein 7 [Plakobranchus ocellatus]|uniref:La-related protein 7 n=1 Tax=Plakobranchus ocellatus TaxID=259542 RepID=A0AAV4AYV2_9GAST|nr:LA-related protein 7 [Plakobranchus ocellatus]
MAETDKREDSKSLKAKLEKRSASYDDEDTLPPKKQKLSIEDAASGCVHISEASVEASPEKVGINLKRTHADVSDDLEFSAKKSKLDAEIEDKDGMDEENSTVHEDNKRPHHRRMKHTLNLVLEQMEFYFGDSSLSKDRYLKSMVDSSPDAYVDLSIFANFNKLQTLHKDGISQKVLIQALSRSKMLQLSNDKTKVKRITPYQEISQEETDRRTVYVEHLPSHATHMWVKQIFSQCGKVAYVSLPTYKTSKHIKGFAFVEYTTPEEAERACAMLNDPLPDKAMERPGKFPKTNKTLDRLQKIAPLGSAQDSNEENDAAQDKEEEAKKDTDADMKKRKKKKAKKKKSQDISVEDSSVQADTESKEQKPEGKKKKKKKKRKLSQFQESAVDEESASSEQSKEFRDTAEANEKRNMLAVSNKDTGDQAKAEIDGSIDHKSRSVMDKSEETSGITSSTQAKRKKKKKKKSKGEVTETSEEVDEKGTENGESGNNHEIADFDDKEKNSLTAPKEGPVKKLSHRERKLLRQEDIRRKKQQRLLGKDVEQNGNSSNNEKRVSLPQPSDDSNKELENSQLTSILKLKKAAEKKRVEFDPVPITTEFIEAKGARKRKKSKREKPHLRVISKKDWISLKEEYISRQKSHMKALKESLRELRQQENKEAGRQRTQQVKPLDLEDVFGTKPLKLSHEAKMAHVEKMKFTPNVIVQWWCSHEMHRDKIRTMFKESHASSIAYIDANEEARSGYIRFKDETSAEEFAKMSRTSDSFMARVLPADQQEEYWEKANSDRMKKLGRKKKEQGCDRIARKMFQRNKATFFNKPSRIVFDDAEKEVEDSNNFENSAKDKALKGDA